MYKLCTNAQLIRIVYSFGMAESQFTKRLIWNWAKLHLFSDGYKVETGMYLNNFRDHIRCHQVSRQKLGPAWSGPKKTSMLQGTPKRLETHKIQVMLMASRDISLHFARIWMQTFTHLGTGPRRKLRRLRRVSIVVSVQDMLLRVHMGRILV